MKSKKMPIFFNSTYVEFKNFNQSLVKHFTLLKSGLELICLGVGSFVFYFAAVLIYEAIKGESAQILIRDPAAIGQLPAYAGIFSQLGIMLWSATTAICLFSSQVLSYFSPGKKQRFLWTSGLLTLLLTIDDAFMLHEDILPRRGISEHLVLLIYLAFILFYLIKFTPLIVKTEYNFFLMALFCFGGSMLVDFISPDLSLGVIEEAFKYVGIVYWTAYFYHVASSELCGAKQRSAV